MSTSLIDADSLLALDVGTVHTRALLFDVVNGRYRFLGSGVAKTTAGAPYHDILEGMRRAVDHLQQITGRTLVDMGEQLIIPANETGAGVDQFAATLSAGPPFKVAVVGLLEDVTQISARRLAETVGTGEVEAISLNDRRKTEDRIDAILRLRPDFIVIAGGTEGGATQSMRKLLETVGLACYLTPDSMRPAVLYAGNHALVEEVHSTLGDLTNLYIAPNIRPTLDQEQVDAGQASLVDIFRRVRAGQIGGVQELNNWAGGGLMPTSSAFGRIIRFFNKALKSKRGILGVDVGASRTTVAAAFQDQLVQGVYPDLGLGVSLMHLLDRCSLNDITRWIYQDVSDDYVREYLYRKALYPASLPAVPEDLAIEQALARLLLQLAVKRASPGFPPGVSGPQEGLLPGFEAILASGSVFTQAPSLAQSLLALLDGLQPTGTTIIVLDRYHILPALGAAAAANPLLAVQLIDSNAPLYLATVISPVGKARPGSPILNVKISYESGHETALEVKYGSLEVLPLPMGQTARLRLQPLQRFDVGMGAPGRSGGFEVHGSSIGIVIDARGRPVDLPDDPARRRELIRKWLLALGG